MGIFSKLRYYLNTETRMEMYHALFNSHLLYALLCWGPVCPTTLNCLQIVQNKAIRNMMKSPWFFGLDDQYLNHEYGKLLIFIILRLPNLCIAIQTEPYHRALIYFFHEINDLHYHNTRVSSNRDYITLISDRLEVYGLYNTMDLRFGTISHWILKMLTSILFCNCRISKFA